MFLRILVLFGDRMSFNFVFLSSLFQNKRPTITMPPNLQTVSLKFARRRSAKVMGSLATRESEPKEGERVQGILVTHNFHSKVVKAEDLATYTPLRVGSISSKLHVPFNGSVDTLRLFLSEMFSGVIGEDIEEDGNTCTQFSLHNNMVSRLAVGADAVGHFEKANKATTSKVSVLLGKTKGVAIVGWAASPAGDVIADAVIALLMHAQSSAASIRLTSKPCRHPRPSDDDSTPSSKKQRAEDTTSSRLVLIKDTLKDQFEKVEAVYEGNTGIYEIITDTGLESSAVNDDGVLTCTAKVAFADDTGSQAEITVECSDMKLASHVRECLNGLAATLSLISS